MAETNTETATVADTTATTTSGGAGTATVAQTTTTASGGQAGPILGADGRFLPGWSQQLGGTKELEAKFTEPKALVSSYQQLEKLISAKGIIPPGPNATPEEKSAFYKALGRPDKPEDYGIKRPEKIGDKPFPKELWDDAGATSFAKWAHEKGWSKQQVADAIEFQSARTLQEHAGFDAFTAQERQQAEAKLKADWGPKYAENLALANRATAQLWKKGEEPAHLANDPEFARAMAKVGQMIGEGPAAGARGTQGGMGTDYDAQIKAIYGDKQHPWHPENKKLNPKAHEEAVAHVTRLYKLKNGEAA